ncbi:hypothetical protein, partial [Salmonella enterica]|uniref:hypothetical protein n=1 Tax=Salmonella enterica TaxID=28901 RepID=UPI0020C36BC9
NTNGPSVSMSLPQEAPFVDHSSSSSNPQSSSVHHGNAAANSFGDNPFANPDPNSNNPKATTRIRLYRNP